MVKQQVEEVIPSRKKHYKHYIQRKENGREHIQPVKITTCKTKKVKGEGSTCWSPKNRPLGRSANPSGAGNVPHNCWDQQSFRHERMFNRTTCWLPWPSSWGGSSHRQICLLLPHGTRFKTRSDGESTMKSYRAQKEGNAPSGFHCASCCLKVTG